MRSLDSYDKIKPEFPTRVGCWGVSWTNGNAPWSHEGRTRTDGAKLGLMWR